MRFCCGLLSRRVYGSDASSAGKAVLFAVIVERAARGFRGIAASEQAFDSAEDVPNAGAGSRLYLVHRKLAHFEAV